MADPSPLAGIRVVEVAAGVSEVGSGLAVSIPGRVLGDLGASVVRIEVGSSTLDAGVEHHRVWHHGKERVQVDSAELAEVVRRHTTGADVLVLAGPEELIEGNGLSPRELARHRPGLVTARIRPGFDAAGPLGDHELLLHARTGLMGQLAGNHPRPIFVNLRIGAAGAGLTATVGALALLIERETSGDGGWAETSLYDGLLAILPMIIGQVEHASPSIELLWHGQGPAGTLTFRCGDGRHLQLWFGAKGAYEGFLHHIGDPPSEAGYNADLLSGALGERTGRWAELFAGRPRQDWLDDLAGNDFRCEPILRPGEVLEDEHARSTGLAVTVDDPERGPITVLGPVATVAPAGGTDRSTVGANGLGEQGRRRLLEGVRVLDLSAYLAGPVAPQILAELGADVIKVEPVAGDVHRGMEPLFAAGQRGKRAIALDLKAPEAAEVLSRLFERCDVVHHNSRVGLAERLGYDEATVRRANPGVVYSFASGFGPSGPRALLPANDYLMQALSGMESAVGGPGEPTFTSWGSVDVTGGWVSACGILAGLLARRRTGRGQSVGSTLLGAGALVTSGPFVAPGGVVEGPLVDAGQTGLGAAYRIYRCADQRWLALAVPDATAWTALLYVVGGAGEEATAALPVEPPPLRCGHHQPQPEERILEAVFVARDATRWRNELRAAGVPAEVVLEADRRRFISRLLDDPVNRQLGRVVGYRFGDRGRLEQPALALRLGPEPRPAAAAHLPDLGEHTEEILAELGFDVDQRRGLRQRGAVSGTPVPSAGREETVGR